MLRPRCTWVHVGVGHVPSFPSPETSECLRFFRLRGSETLPLQDLLKLQLQAGSALHNLTCSRSEKGPPRWLATPQPILTLRGDTRSWSQMWGRPGWRGEGRGRQHSWTLQRGVQTQAPTQMALGSGQVPAPLLQDLYRPFTAAKRQKQLQYPSADELTTTHCSITQL